MMKEMEYLTRYFVRVRGDDGRNPTFIRDFEEELAIAKAMHADVKIGTHEEIHDDVYYKVTTILDTDPATKHVVLYGKIETKPLKKKVEQIVNRKERKKRHSEGKPTKSKEYYEKVEDELKQRETTHYIKTSAWFLTPRDALTISIRHWRVERFFEDFKRVVWSRWSYKKEKESKRLLQYSRYLRSEMVSLHRFQH